MYDVAGRVVRRLAAGTESAGWKRVYWDGRDEAGESMPGGIYLCRLEACGSAEAREMVVLR